MPKYINADEILSEESEAYTRLKQSVSNDINNDVSSSIVIRYIRMRLKQLLDDAPAADVAPVVHGRWIMSRDRPDTIICSRCGNAFDVWKADINRHNYCPNCSARMMEVVDHDKS